MGVSKNHVRGSPGDSNLSDLAPSTLVPSLVEYADSSNCNRAAELDAPIQMCDGLSRNLPGELDTILANCLAHGRRKFVEVAPSFPPQCRYVLEMLGEVYGYDEQAREQSLSPEERLRFHQLTEVVLPEARDVMEVIYKHFCQKG